MPSGGQMTSLIPGANVSGSNVAVPGSPVGGIGPGVGSTQNPFMMSTAGTGQNMPAFPANGYYGGSASAVPMTGQSVNNILGSGTNWNDMQNTLGKIYGSGPASAIISFLQSGAGYNPQVAQALIQQMQPQIEQGQQQIAEEFGNAGLRFGSPAALGMADYNSQVQGNIGAMMSNLYENSVQNYQNMLMGLMGPEAQYQQNKPSIWDMLSGGLSAGGNLMSGLGSLIPGAGILSSIGGLLGGIF